jgi:hypothetical protein
MRRFFGSRGSISRVTIESQALKNNMLDDSSVRAVDVYVPAGHDGPGLAPACGSCRLYKQWPIPVAVIAKISIHIDLIPLALARSRPPRDFSRSTYTATCWAL